MLVGITYDLRSAYLAAGYGEEETAEFDQESTITAIDDAIRTMGHETVRIGHVRDLVASLAAGERWDLVFNICEGLRGVGRESQVPCLLEAYGIPSTFSDASVLALCLNKAWTKAVVGHAVPTAAFHVVESIADVAQVNLPLPLFVKPLAEGTGKGVTAGSVIRHRADLHDQCERLLDTFRQPALVETYLPGREFTVSILGTGNDSYVLGTFEIILLSDAEPEVYSYVNKEEWEERVKYLVADANSDPIVAQAQAHALAAWRILGCRDAGRIDMRCDTHGMPHFIEVNPLAGLNPTHSDLPMLAIAIGLSYPELIERIVTSASKRIVLAGEKPVSKTDCKVA